MKKTDREYAIDWLSRDMSRPGAEDALSMLNAGDDPKEALAKVAGGVEALILYRRDCGITDTFHGPARSRD